MHARLPIWCQLKTSNQSMFHMWKIAVQPLSTKLKERFAALDCLVILRTTT